MYFKELRKELAEKTGLYQKDIAALFNALSEIVIENLEEGKEVHLNKLGIFYPAKRAAGVYKVPKCKEEVRKGPRVIPKFKCSYTIKEALKAG